MGWVLACLLISAAGGCSLSGLWSQAKHLNYNFNDWMNTMIIKPWYTLIHGRSEMTNYSKTAIEAVIFNE